MFVYSFCFFLSFAKTGMGFSPNPEWKRGRGYGSKPHAEVGSAFFLGGSGFGCIPPTSQASHMFDHFCKIAEAEHFFGGSGLGCIPATSQAFAHVLLFFFKVAEAGEGFVPNPERKPCLPTPGDAKGARRGKREKGGGAAAPNPGKDGQFFVFFL
jgi:hypothetical protein